MSNKKNSKLIKKSKNADSYSKQNNQSDDSKKDGWVGDPKQEDDRASASKKGTQTYRNSNETYDDEALNI